jgi:CBS domain-containing protein
MTDLNLEMYTVSSAATILDAAGKILSNRSRCVCVLEEDKVVGVFSQGDVLRALLNNISPYAPLTSVMKPSFWHLPQRDLHRALELVRKYLITMIPVIDKDFHILDIITLEQLIQAMELVER